MKTSRIAGLGLLAVYIGSVVVANWLTTRYGLVTIFPGLQTAAGTAVIGGVIMTRDLLQDALGRVAVLAAIAAGAILSFGISSREVAIASAVTFLMAETAEFAVYTPLRRRCKWGTWKWARTVGIANATGSALDSVLFLWLAPFALTWSTAGGQVLGKLYVTAAVAAIGMWARSSRRPAEVLA